MMPKTKPRLPYRAALDQVEGHNVHEPVALLGVRGYYRDSMGKVGFNDRNIYDDAIFVVSSRLFAAFNANTDPSFFRKGVATLLPGVHPYKLGNHGISRSDGGYPALRPATKGEQLPVKRDGELLVPSARPGVAINIHRGGYNTTSSEGCQTIYPTQWDSFYSSVKMLMREHKMNVIKYVLIEGPVV